MNNPEPSIAPVTPEQVPAIVSLAERSKLSHWPYSAYEGAIGSPDSIFLGLNGHEMQLLGFIVGSVAVAWGLMLFGLILVAVFRH